MSTKQSFLAVRTETDLLGCDLLKTLALVNNAGAELISKAHTEGGSRGTFTFSLLQG